MDFKFYKFNHANKLILSDGSDFEGALEIVELSEADYEACANFISDDILPELYYEHGRNYIKVLRRKIIYNKVQTVSILKDLYEVQDRLREANEKLRITELKLAKAEQL
jgi:hypothetical protein